MTFKSRRYLLRLLALAGLVVSAQLAGVSMAALVETFVRDST